MDKIVLSEMDANFKNEIASCPVAEVHEEYDPRKIIRMSILGMKDEVLSSDVLWMCSRCYTCYALCPQGVKFTDVLGILRDMAVKQGYVSKEQDTEARELDKFVQDLRCHLIDQKLHPSKDKEKEIQEMVDQELKNKWKLKEKNT